MMVLFFTHIPFVVNHTINATPPERLQQYLTLQLEISESKNAEPHGLRFLPIECFRAAKGQRGFVKLMILLPGALQTVTFGLASYVISSSLHRPASNSMSTRCRPLENTLNAQGNETHYIAYQGHPETGFKLHVLKPAEKLAIPPCSLKDFQLWHVSPVVSLS